jgi:hypothetical protein
MQLVLIEIGAVVASASRNKMRRGRPSQFTISGKGNDRRGYCGPCYERNILDSRSLLSARESPLNALLFWAFSDEVFRSLHCSLSRTRGLTDGAFGSPPGSLTPSSAGWFKC